MTSPSNVYEFKEYKKDTTYVNNEIMKICIRYIQPKNANVCCETVKKVLNMTYEVIKYEKVIIKRFTNFLKFRYKNKASVCKKSSLKFILSRREKFGSSCTIFVQYRIEKHFNKTLNRLF